MNSTSNSLLGRGGTIPICTIEDGYDAGRVQVSVNPLGFRTTYTYDPVGNQTAALDARNNLSITVYDALNRLRASVDQLGNRTTFSYDPDSRQIEILDSSLHTPAILNVSTTSELRVEGITIRLSPRKRIYLQWPDIQTVPHILTIPDSGRGTRPST